MDRIHFIEGGTDSAYRAISGESDTEDDRIVEIIERDQAVVQKPVRVDALKLKNKPATIELPDCFAYHNFCLIFLIIYRVLV
ncbi:MAG: hypothetical protein EZS28_035257 [Streblomastix strix]|uniref:Uncharacterized protein n=1 Tax=Streblomastix strix TaxID=222440 RepID=A0A5J4UEM1_9EUKA|nr:MAG: hypothetical protein EZS28_035257 [Streblomastix strix]